MQGRQEHEQIKLARIAEILQEAPVYMKQYLYSIHDKSYTTQYEYIRHVLDFLSFIQKEYKIDINELNNFKNVKASMITVYMADMKDISNSFKALKLYAIKSFFDYLLGDDYIDHNPCDRVSTPKDNVEHKITYLTKEEIEIVKYNITNGVGNCRSIEKQRKWIKRDYALVMLGLSLGLRISSITEINIEDIDLENNEIKIIEKGNTMRSVTFSDKLKNILIDWMEDREFKLLVANKECNALFISNQMKRISTRAIGLLIDKYTYNIDKHITPHKLRSTCATNVYSQTGDIYLTANVLGHRNISNTMRYAQVTDERKQQAAKAMDSILF